MLLVMEETNYTLVGFVVRGDGYGRRLGFPTANLEQPGPLKQGIVVPSGVYAGTAELFGSGTVYKAGIVIGPGKGKRPQKIEAHLLDFSGDLYGKRLELKLFSFIREFKVFTDEDSLKKAIAADLEEVRELIRD